MRRWLPAAFIAGAVIFSVAVYSRLPEEVPMHWGIAGDPDRFGPRLQGAFMMPLVMIVLYLGMQWYPSRDPRAANIAKFRDVYDTAVTASIAMLGGVHVAALGSALGWRFDMRTVVLAGLGVLFLLLGNLLPRVRSNFIFGIRTPWTLSSERVWARSHRVGGYALVAAGLLTLVAAFLGGGLGLAVALTSAVVAAAIPVVYSYFLWSRERHGPTVE